MLYHDAPHDSEPLTVYKAELGPDHVSQCFHCRKVSVHCPQCQGDQVNWDQPLIVSTLCEGCDIAPEFIQYTWSLYSVDASSKPVTEGRKDAFSWIWTVNHCFIFKKKILTFIFFLVLVPFCYSVDLSAPSTIVEGPATSPQTPAAFTLHSGATDASQYTAAVNISAFVSLIENVLTNRLVCH